MVSNGSKRCGNTSAKQSKGNDFKVLMKLLSVLDYENLIQVSQAEIARELNMHRQHVQRSIKRLLDLGIVLEGVKIGISRSYRLNPNFGWKGSAKGHREALTDHLEASEVAKPVAAAASSAQTPQQRADAAAYMRTLVYM